MAEKWIWLDKPEFLSGETLDQNQIADRTAFLFVSRDATTFELCVLVKQSAEAVRGLLRLLQGEEQNLTGVLTNDWLVTRLKRWKFKQTPTIDPDPAAGLNSESFVVPGSVSFELGFELAFSGLKATAKNATYDKTNKTLTVTLGLGLNGGLKENEFVVTFKDGQLHLGTDNPVGDGPLPDVIAGAGEVKLITFSADDLAPKERIGLETTITKAGNFEVPLGIPAAKATLTWPTVKVRVHVAKDLSKDELILDVLAPDDGPLGSANFELPLIEANAPDHRPDASKRLLLTKQVGDGDTFGLVTLKFSVSLNGPDDRSMPLLRFRIANENNSVAEVLSALLISSGTFAKHLDDFKERTLSGLLGNLNSFGDHGPVNFSISDVLKKIDASVTGAVGGLKARLGCFPVLLQLDAKCGNQIWSFIAVACIDLWKGQLRDNRIFVSVLGDAQKNRVLDFELAALMLPEPIDLAQFAEQLKDAWKSGTFEAAKLDRDGYLDIAAGELVFDFQRSKGTPRSIAVAFPGGKSLQVADPIKLSEELKKRVVLRTELFSPSSWPAAETVGENKVHLRLGSTGLSLKARVDSSHSAEIIQSPSVFLRLEQEKDQYKSEFVIINNQIRSGTLIGKLDVPGFKKLNVDLILGLRQTDPSKKPDVFAEMAGRLDGKPIVEMTVPGLRGRVDELKVKLAWKDKDDEQKWDCGASASGDISFTGLSDLGGVSGLDKPDAFPFRNLDLMKLRSSEFELPLRRAHAENDVPTKKEGGNDTEPKSSLTEAKPGRWEVLGGLIAVGCTDVSLAVKMNGDNLESAQLIVKKPRLEFKSGSGGAFDVALETDELKLIWDGSRKIELKFSGLIGFQIRIGTNIAFEGKGGWERNATERYFGAKGALRCSGFPQMETTIKLGAGYKSNGKLVPNIVFYGSLGIEADLFPGAVLKRMGAGLSINNRLRGLGKKPEPREILTKLDQIRPAELENWIFDVDSELYVAFIGTAWLGSNRGGDKIINAYTMSLTMIVDTNLDIVAAGEVWLFSSLAKIELPANRSRPAMAGVIVFRPRKKTLSFVAETKPNPFIEANEQLGRILSQCSARFSFYVSDEVVDYYLEEVRYSEQLFGISVQASGGYRIAAGRFGVLMRAWLNLYGNLPQRKLEVPGVGGFEFQGNLAIAADFGGLVDSNGASAYGSVNAALQFQVAAYVLVPMPHLEMRRMEQTISVTIGYPSCDCGRWGCDCGWEEETFEKTIIVDVPELIMRPERFYLDQRALDLTLSGDIAFDQSGQIGFQGSLSISVSIFGHELSIAPSWNYHPEVVNRVRQKVIAVEQHLNALRNLPRPTPTPPGDDSISNTSQRWTQYERSFGGRKWCVLVPSPESGNENWYAPMVANLRDYANVPRTTKKKPTIGESQERNLGAASDTERRHPSPLRHSVVRMLVPIKNKDNQRRLLDLIMPWDRSNLKCLPDPTSTAMRSNSPARLEAIRKLTQIEAEVLATVSDSGIKIDQQNPWKLDLSQPIVIRDPRIGTLDRRFWKLMDQLERPDYAPPFEYRRASELVPLGLGPSLKGARHDSELGAVLDFERLREKALRTRGHKSTRSDELGRTMRSRSVFLTSLLNDFQRPQGPDPQSRYSTLAYGSKDDKSSILVERKTESGELPGPKDEMNQRIVTRRRLPIICTPTEEAGRTKWLASLTPLQIFNATEVLLRSDFIAQNDTVNIPLQISWKNGDGNDQTASLNAGDKKLDLLLLDIPSNQDSPVSATSPVLKPVKVNVQRDGYDGMTVDYIFFELHPAYEGGIERKIGLTFDLLNNEIVDSDNILIVRNEQSDEDDLAISKTFDYQKPFVKKAFSNFDISANEFQRWIMPLTPCQGLIPGVTTASESTLPTDARLIVRLPLYFKDEFFSKYSDSINRFEVLRRFDWQSEPVSLGEYPVRLTTWSESGRTYIYTEPFLASDEFAVVVDEHNNDWKFADERLRPNSSTVQYYLRAIPFGETARSADKVPLLNWGPPISLFLPPRREPLPALAMVIKADTIVGVDNNPSPKFVLYESNGQQFEKRWKDNEKTPGLSLELWAEELPISLSGFYASGDELSSDLELTQGSISSPSDLRSISLPENINGKFLYRTLSYPMQKSATEASKTKLRAGVRYRFFVRPTAQVEDLRVVPVQLFISRQLPEDLRPDSNPSEESAAAKLLPIDALELINNNEVARITSPAVDKGDRWYLTNDLAYEILQATPCRSDLPEPERQQLPRPVRASWDAPESGLDGGIELFLQDWYNSSRIDRTLIEIQSELVFQRSLDNFQNASIWQVHREHSSGNLWSPENHQPRPKPLIKPFDYFLWQAPNNPLLSRLKTCRDSVGKVLTEIINGDQVANWVTLHQALTNWFTSASIYFRSPVVIDREKEELRFAELFEVSQRLFLVLVLPDPTPEKHAKKLASIIDLIQRIEKADPRKEAIPDIGGDEADQFKKRLLDHEVASRLAAVILRRLEITQAIHTPTVDGSMDLPEAVHASEMWPLESEWNDQLRRVTKENAGEYPLTTGLLKEFGLSTDSEKTIPEQMSETRTGLLNLLQKQTSDDKEKGCLTNIERLALFKTDVDDIKELMAKQVTEAAGLTAALVGLNQVTERKGWRLIRRPHHQRVLDSAEETLDSYFPVTGGAEVDVHPSDLIIHYFNFLERMGFAIDLAVVDEDNRYFNQQELIRELQTINWEVVLEATGGQHQVYVVAGREPHTSLLPYGALSESVGYAFVKLAIVPNEFLGDLAVASAKVELVLKDNSLKTDPVFNATGMGLVDVSEVHVTLLNQDAVDSRSPVRRPVKLETVQNDLSKITGVTAGNKVRIDGLSWKDGADTLPVRVAAWLELRSLKVDLTPGSASLVRLRSAALGLDHVADEYLKKAEPNTAGSKLKIVYVEPWGTRWQTVPSVGRRSQVLLAMPDRLGRKMLLAGRRVSRYEPFLRWLDPSSVPSVNRIDQLGADKLHEVVIQRQILAGEEPMQLPVAVQSHPTRIEFLYRLPPSGAQSLLSAEAQRRTGFIECQVEFSRKLNTSFSNKLAFKDVNIPGGKVAKVKEVPSVAEPGFKLVGTDVNVNDVLFWTTLDSQTLNLATVDSILQPSGKFTLSPATMAPGSDVNVTHVSMTNPPFEAFKVVRTLVKDKIRILSRLSPGQSFLGPVVLRIGTIQIAGLLTSYIEQTQTATLSFQVPDGGGQTGEIYCLYQSVPIVQRRAPRSIEPSDVQLFRHERMISLVNLPHYLDYGMAAAPRFIGDSVDSLLGITNSAIRYPSLVSARKPDVKNPGNSTRLEIILYLNSLGDTLTSLEYSQAKQLDSPQPIEVAGRSAKVHSRDLLDTKTQYQLWVELAGDVSSASLEPVHVKIIDIESISPPAGTPQQQVTVKPVPGLGLKVAADTASAMLDEAEVNVVVSPVIPDVIPIYWIRFVVDIGSATPREMMERLKIPMHYRLMTIRDGVESSMVQPPVVK